MKTLQKEYFSLFILFFLVALGVYHNGLSIGYYADDFQRVFSHPDRAMLTGFSEANYSDKFYRPLETFILGFLQSNWGWETLPIRIINLLLHSATALFIYRALRFLKLTVVTSFSTAIFLLVSQCAAAAVLGNDTLSQVSGTFFSVLCLWLLYRYYSIDNSERKITTYIGCLLCFLSALLSKETSAGLMLAILIMVYLQSDKSSRLKTTIIRLIPFICCSIGYLLLRSLATARIPIEGSGIYFFSLGLNIPKNIALFFGELVLPVSSLSLLRSIHFAENFFIISTILFTILFCGTIGFGIWRSGRGKLSLLFIVLTIFGLFPAFLLSHVAELYVSNALPYIAVLIGFGIEYYVLQQYKSSVLTWSAAMIFIAVIISNVIAVNEKAVAMKTLADRTEKLLPQIVDSAKTLPQHSMMYLVNPKQEYFDYAVYSLHGFRVVTSADSVVRFLADRPDIHIWTADSANCAEMAMQYPGVGFSYDTLNLKLFKLSEHFGAK